MKFIVLISSTILLSGCAVSERIDASNNAEKAKIELIGVEAEKILACMGAPNLSAVKGETEVWTYESSSAVSSNSGYANSLDFVGSLEDRTPNYSCKANVVFVDGLVSNIFYRGVSGGLLSQRAECGKIVEACLEQQNSFNELE